MSTNGDVDDDDDDDVDVEKRRKTKNVFQTRRSSQLVDETQKKKSPIFPQKGAKIQTEQLKLIKTMLAFGRGPVSGEHY